MIPIGVTLIKPTSIDTPLPQRGRNYMDREPPLPPPIYRPEEVAKAILHAAVHPRREIYVGGAGPALSMFRRFAPQAYDHLAPAISHCEKRAEAPRRPEGVLHRPEGGGETRGNAPGYVRSVSTYTRAGLHPAVTAAMSASAAVLALAVLGRRSSRV